MSDFSEKLLTLRKKLNLTQAEMGEKLGLSASYIYQLESDNKTPSEIIAKLVDMITEQVEAGDESLMQSSGLNEGYIPITRGKTERKVPVLGWAHCGAAQAYEELPLSWAKSVPTDCRDEKAFGVILEGDSMEPTFKEGDTVILMPETEPYSGCIVVARFSNDGVVLRRLELAGEKITLIPLNERYEITKHKRSDFDWIYPVWGRWTQMWKGC